MLLIALPILAVVWVGVAIVVVGMCASAAAGDRALTRAGAPTKPLEPAKFLRIA